MNIENNKIIAKFMGNFPSNNGLYSINGKTTLPSELKYHSDWNWLMPVVEKIEAHNSDIDKKYFSFKIFPSCVSIYVHKKKKKSKIAESFCIDIKEGIYDACLQYIEQHNQWYKKQLLK